MNSGRPRPKLNIGPRLLFTAALTVLVVLCLHLEHGRDQLSALGQAAVIGIAAGLILPWLFSCRADRLLMRLSAVLLSAALLLVVGSGIIFAAARHWERGHLTPTEPERTELFADRNVLILVPHEDDEVNLCGGIIEQYIAAGSTVRICCSTNGDAFGGGETRMREMLRAAEQYGIPAENVLFLGYGDGWDSVYSHYAYAPANEVLTSSSGHTAAYGLPEHPTLCEGENYTRAGFCRALREVLLQYRPDTIFCIDTDPQLEHRTLSQLFEEVLGGILSEQTDWHPAVLKGFAYEPAWDAQPAIQHGRQNSASFAGERPAAGTQYKSAEALRLPAAECARSVLSGELTSVGAALRVYRSQDAILRADCVAAAERLYFLRRTDSLLYGVEAEASRGDAACLTDFQVSRENSFCWPPRTELTDGVWAAAPGDSVRFTLPEPAELGSVVLYDNPSLQDNVLALTLTLNDDTSVEFGAPDPGGSASEFILPETCTVSSITITVTACEGENAGLAEAEAFAADAAAPPFPLFALRDEAGNSVSRLVLGKSGEEFLFPSWQDAEPKELFLQTAGDLQAELLPDGRLQLQCPPSGEGSLAVRDAEGTLLLELKAANPRPVMRFCIDHMNIIEQLRPAAQWNYYRGMLHSLLLALRGIQP